MAEPPVDPIPPRRHSRARHVDEEGNDRRRGLSLSRWTVIWTIVLVVLGVPGFILAWRELNSESGRGREVGTLVVIRPDLLSLEIYAVPSPSKPVQYLRGGTQLRVDCIRSVGKNAFAHISGDDWKDDWIDATQLERTDGGRFLGGSFKVPECPSA